MHVPAQPGAPERAALLREVGELLKQHARVYLNQHLLLAMAAQLNRIAQDEISREEAMRPTPPTPPAVLRDHLTGRFEGRLPVLVAAHPPAPYN